LSDDKVIVLLEIDGRCLGPQLVTHDSRWHFIDEDVPSGAPDEISIHHAFVGD
jgi:hypothetical protein